MKDIIEKNILERFLYAHKLKFSEIEKSLKIRLNKLNYHLQKLIKKNILIKERDFYKLSETSEYIIPYLSNKKHVLTVILIHIGNQDNAFLIKRNKRPYKDLLSLPGGRLILGESIENATERILEKFNVRAKFKEIKSISLEHLKKNGNVIASYLLIYVTAKGEGIELTDIKKNKKKIIKSDYHLITSNFKKRISIEEINSAI
ncbi:MAG: hypothetical protein ABIF88_00550 [archaeon]